MTQNISHEPRYCWLFLDLTPDTVLLSHQSCCFIQIPAGNCWCKDLSCPVWRWRSSSLPVQNVHYIVTSSQRQKRNEIWSVSFQSLISIIWGTKNKKQKKGHTLKIFWHTCKTQYETWLKSIFSPVFTKNWHFRGCIHMYYWHCEWWLSSNKIDWQIDLLHGLTLPGPY